MMYMYFKLIKNPKQIIVLSYYRMAILELKKCSLISGVLYNSIGYRIIPSKVLNVVCLWPDSVIKQIDFADKSKISL